MQGPAIFLAQFAGDEPPFNSLAALARWAGGLGYKGVQIPTWDRRLFDLKLAAESDARVCRAAGSNRQSPAELRAKWARSVAIKLLANPSWVTRTVALLDPNASPLALRRRRHASSVYWLERFAVAVHPSTTDDVRDALKDDANRIVAAAARGEVGWPQ